MKKLLSFLLVAAMLLTFAACGATEPDPTDAPPAADAPQDAAPEAEAPEAEPVTLTVLWG